jgi:hypothetical protein
VKREARAKETLYLYRKSAQHRFGPIKNEDSEPQQTGSNALVKIKRVVVCTLRNRKLVYVEGVRLVGRNVGNMN